MRKFLAILAFLAGGISVEIAKPINCLLITTTQPRARRNTLRSDDGK
jgi:hypothetical protein